MRHSFWLSGAGMLRVLQRRCQKTQGVQVLCARNRGCAGTRWGALIAREVVVAGLLGLTMAIAVSGIGWLRGGPEIAMIVSTMIVVVLVGSLIGLLSMMDGPSLRSQRPQVILPHSMSQ